MVLYAIHPEFEDIHACDYSNDVKDRIGSGHSVGFL